MRIKDTNFTKEYVINVYEKLIDNAVINNKCHKVDKALKLLNIAARWMFNFNIIYSDCRIDNLIIDISKKIFGDRKVYDKDDSCYVFIDSILTDRCLAYQYLYALTKLNKHIVYIAHGKSFTNNPEVIKLLNEYCNSNIYFFKTSKSIIDDAIKINKIILSYKPSGIFLHLLPDDVLSLLSIYSISSVSIFNIDLQDHAFWIGSSLIDYNFIFRSYGENLSKTQRGLALEKLIRLPYFPINYPNISFNGFPQLPQDAIRIFTGGSSYKMLGKQDVFFKIMDIILDCSDLAYILIASTGDSSMLKTKIGLMKNSRRVILLGERKDINEVYKHCDIFLSTYPRLGGLMTQYAAMHSLPIISYAMTEDVGYNVECMVNHKFRSLKTFHTFEEIKEYASKLINNNKFRKSEGVKNKNAIITSDDFVSLLNKALTIYSTDLEWNEDVIPNYEKIQDFYLENENKYLHTGLITIIRNLKLSVFRYIPTQTIAILQCLMLKSFEKLCRNLKNIL